MAQGNPYDQFVTQPGYGPTQGPPVMPQGPQSSQTPLPTGTPDYWTSRNPVGSVSPFFKQMGYSGDAASPWVNVFTNQIAGGLPLLFAAQNPSATAAQGFTEYMKNVMRGGIGQQGNWLTTDQFGQALRNVIGRGANVGSGSSLDEPFGASTSGQEQFKNLQELIGAGAAMSFTGLAQGSMLKDLSRRWTEYVGLVQTGALPQGANFREWLANQTSFFQNWFPHLT